MRGHHVDLVTLVPFCMAGRRFGRSAFFFQKKNVGFL